MKGKKKPHFFFFFFLQVSAHLEFGHKEDSENNGCFNGPFTMYREADSSWRRWWTPEQLLYKDAGVWGVNAKLPLANQCSEKLWTRRAKGTLPDSHPVKGENSESHKNGNVMDPLKWKDIRCCLEARARDGRTGLQMSTLGPAQLKSSHTYKYLLRTLH